MNKFGIFIKFCAYPSAKNTLRERRGWVGEEPNNAKHSARNNTSVRGVVSLKY